MSLTHVDNHFKCRMSLSRYFENTDSPSVFDNILPTGPSAGTTDAPVQEVASVPDHVRDLWLRPDFSAVAMLTSPGILSNTDLSDPILEKSTDLLGADVAKERNTLLPDDVTQDERGLRKLIEEGCFRSAVNLTSRLLCIYGQGVGRLGQPAKHTPHSLQLWFTRFNLLVKLGLYDLVTSEAEAFQQLNRPDLFYEFYPEMYTRKGSMASFSFRLLLAELPMYVSGQEKVALDNLSNISSICRQIVDQLTEKSEVDFWKRRYARSLQSMVNVALSMKNYGLVHSLMRQLEEFQIWTTQERHDLHSTWCRIYLQCGDIFNADQQHSKARLQSTSNSSQMDPRDLVDKGLRSVAQNDFDEALNFFNSALKNDPENTAVLNNIAVCQLYTGKLDEAIKTFEKAFSASGSLNEYLILNLATLYELQSSNAQAQKLELLRKLNRQKGDLSLNLDYCLKLKLGS